MAGPVIVKKITGVEMLRDGGTYLIWFNGMDRRAYELRVPIDTAETEDAPPSWKPPELYYEGDLIDEPGWEGAAAALEGQTLAKRNPEKDLLDDALELIAAGGVRG